MTGRRLAVALLALALLAAQMLGLAHRVLHVPGAAGGMQLQAATVHAHDFAGHGDRTPECRLYDQACHGDAAPAFGALALPVVPVPFLLQFLLGEALARWAALYDARGPPSTR